MGQNLACEGCRQRRRKCDSSIPCKACAEKGIECVRANRDLRRNRGTASYLRALEIRVAELENTISLLKQAKSEQESVATEDPIELAREPPHKENDFSNKVNTIIGIYPSNSLLIQRPRANLNVTSSQAELAELRKDQNILDGLSLFFKWLYPGHFMFIHRETFLNAFFGDFNSKSYYCSTELVYAIFALGAQIAPRNSPLSQIARNYYERSKSIVLSKIFQLDGHKNDEATSSLKLAIIQTLLCLAFFDIGLGDNPMAWYLSGLAFRITHEIGLHLNPEAWSHVYEDELSGMDVEVRGRVYWGCYIADHLIALLFGRTTILKLSNSTVPETDELPEIESGIEDFIFDPKCTFSMAKPLKNLIVVCRITEVFAPKIFGQSGFPMQKREHISKFNLEMYNWRKELPKELNWTRKSIIKLEDFNPSRAYIWFHYYLVLISYNKPFIDELQLSRDLVTEHIEELSLLLKKWERCFGSFQTVNLYMVYCVIVSLQCMKTGKIGKRNYQQFINFLKSPSLNYEIGYKYVEIDNENPSNEPLDFLGTLSNGTDLKLEYNLDFTLLNEIDLLIGGSNSSTMIL